MLPDYVARPQAKDLPFSLDGAQSLANTFKSSLTPVVLKLVRHTECVAAMVCHRPNLYIWTRKAKHFPPDVYLLNELHPDSAAFDVMYGNEGKRTALRTEPASRWMSGAPTRNKNIRCQSIKLPDGSVLSTLQLLP